MPANEINIQGIQNNIDECPFESLNDRLVTRCSEMMPKIGILIEIKRTNMNLNQEWIYLFYCGRQCH